MNTKAGTITLTLDLALSAQSKAFLSSLHALEITTDCDAVAAVATPAQSAQLTPPAPGEYWPGQGGYYICTLAALHDMPARHLIAGKDEVEALPWGPRVDVPGATSHVNGRKNTKELVCAGREYKAADWATYYTADGHTDFFLPARLDMIMAHICAPQLFKKSGYYWTSTQDSSVNAFVQGFENGYSNWYGKGSEHRVRAFRVIPLPL